MRRYYNFSPYKKKKKHKKNVSIYLNAITYKCLTLFNSILVNLSIAILYSNLKYDKFILELLLKGHVTLKTQIMAPENVV